MELKAKVLVGAAAGLLVTGAVGLAVGNSKAPRHTAAAGAGPSGRPSPTPSDVFTVQELPTEVASALTSASPLPPAPVDEAPPAGCGVERQELKIGRDAAARNVALAPRDTTIPALTAAAADLSSSRVAPIETTLWRLRVRLLSYKLEADSDYHLVIADSAGHQMIAEIAAPGCDGGSAWPTQIRQARRQFDAALHATSRFKNLDVPVTIVGVGFFDFLHGQRGVAANGVEIHPVLSITFG